MSKAFIQKPAPAFAGTAVNHHGEFIDVKLSDYKGERSFSRLYTGLLRSVAFAHNLLLCFYRKISGFVLLSPRFVSTTYRILCLN